MATQDNHFDDGIPGRMISCRISLILPVLVYLFVVNAWFTLGLSHSAEPESAAHIVLVGSEVEFPPFAFVNKEGHPDGFSVDLIRAVAETMGMRFDITTGSWNTVWNNLVSGSLDILPVVAVSSERSRLVDFSVSHTQTFDAFFVSSGKPSIPDIEAAGGKEIVVMQSDAAHHALLDRQFQGEIILVDTIPQGLYLIASGKHDAFLCSKLIGTLAMQEHRIKGLSAGPIIPDYKRVFAFGIHKGNDDLRDKLNEGLMIVKTNGEYQRIYEKWLNTEEPWLKYRKILVGVISVTTLLVAGTLFWSFGLQRAVRRRTTELYDINTELNREIKIRQELETVLQKTNRNLEEIIRERTKMLTQSEERYRMVADFTYDWEYWLNEEGKLNYMSPSCERITGYSRSDFYENPGLLVSLVIPNDLPAGNVFQHNTPDISHCDMEFRIVTKQNEERWIGHVCRPVFDSAGRYVGRRASNRDVTERKLAEAERETFQDQLIQAQKMESIGRLAGGVAHDFNNMLSIILGYTDFILEKVEPESPLSENLKEIRRATVRSVDLVRQLLAFARKQVVSPIVIDLNETVAQMLKMMKRLIGEEIELSWKPDPSLWMVKIDPSQIDQILANLCVNARDAIGGIGKMTVETTNSRIEKEYCRQHVGFIPGEYIRLSVSDDGCGIDREMIDKVFEPFFTTKESGKGTGLGLSTVYGIVRQNAGFINVYSEPGHGTTFNIYLPRYIGVDDLLLPEPKESPFGMRHETVLVVEDEPVNLKMIGMMLESMGFHVLSADRPHKAIDMAQTHSGDIHLLLTDVIMPEMNGRDLAERIVSLHPEVKCLFMSGYTANVIAHHGILDEGIHFLQKPFTTQGLVSELRKMLPFL